MLKTSTNDRQTTGNLQPAQEFSVEPSRVLTWLIELLSEVETLQEDNELKRWYQSTKL